MADRYLLESSAVDGYQLEDASGVLLLEGLDFAPVITPVRPVVRPYARAAYVLALAFVPLIAPPAVPFDWAASLPSGPFAKDGPAIQYAPLTGPVETVIETGWLRQPPDVVRRPRVVTGGTVAPVEPVATAPAVVIDWLAASPVAPRRAIHPVGGEVAPLYVADVTIVAPLRSWSPSLADVVRRTSVVTGGTVAPVLVEVVAPVGRYNYLLLIGVR